MNFKEYWDQVVADKIWGDIDYSQIRRIAESSYGIGYSHSTFHHTTENSKEFNKSKIRRRDE